MSLEQSTILQNGTPTFLDQRGTAELLHLSERTLERFRLEGRGPVFMKLGKRVMYALPDILAWAEKQRRSSTSDRADTSSVA
jgi:Helix-turn-helix domain